MEAVFFVVVSPLIMAQSRYLLGHITAKAVGLAGAVVAIVLLALVVFAPVTRYTVVANPALVTLILWWALFGAVAAGVYIYGYDERSMGWNAVGAALVSLFVGLYFLIGDWTDPASISYYAGGVILVLAVVAALTHWAIVYPPPFALPRKVAGWVNLVGSAAVGIIGLLALVGAIDLPA